MEGTGELGGLSASDVGDFQLILMLLLLPVLLVMSAFFSGCETALFSLSQHQRRQITRKPSLAANALATLLAETRGLLITLLLGNMTVNVLYFVISTVALIRLREQHDLNAVWASVMSVGTLLVLILLGEVLPKLLASRAALGWSKLFALPLFGVHRVLGPVRAVLNLLVITPLARLIAPSHRPTTLSTVELEALLELSQMQGLIDTREEQLLQQVLSLSQLKVRDLMTPRVDIEAHDLADPPAALIDLIRSTRLSRIPVYRDSLDHVEGVVFARQVLLRRPTTADDLDALIRQVVFVPELQRADQLLVHFRKTGTTFAIAVDEHGGTAGLVTLEDVVEAMIGPISGPYADESAPKVEPISRGVWRIGADLPITAWEDLSRTLGPSPELKTVGGLVMAKLGRLPHVGDRTRVGNVEIEVESMEGLRVRSLIVRIVEASRQDPRRRAGGGEAKS